VAGSGLLLGGTGVFSHPLPADGATSSHCPHLEVAQELLALTFVGHLGDGRATGVFPAIETQSSL